MVALRPDGWVSVRWRGGQMDEFRVGAEGKCDVRLRRQGCGEQSQRRVPTSRANLLSAHKREEYLPSFYMTYTPFLLVGRI